FCKTGASRLHLMEVSEEMADGTSVPCGTSAEPKRAAQLIVVPGDDSLAARASQRRRGQDAGGGLVHTALGIRERDDPGATEIPPQGGDQLIDRVRRGRCGSRWDGS